MARIARVVAPGAPHVVTQRGENGRQVFFDEEDRRDYLKLLADSCRRWSVKVWAWCLLPDRVHLVVSPANTPGLARALGETHRRYAKRTNLRADREGKLWHARFASCPIDAGWLARAVRFVERAPVEANLAARAEDYAWSSARTRAGRAGGDTLTTPDPLPGASGKWAKFLAEPNTPEDERLLLLAERTGRPLGTPEFVADLEKRLGKRLRPRKRGRKPKSGAHRDE